MINHLMAEIRAGMPAPERRLIETSDGRVISYGDMLGLAARMARSLADLGVEPGDRVAAQVEKSPEVVALYLGCVMAGAVYLPLNTAYTRAELDYFVGDAAPRLLVVDPGRRETVAGIGASAPPTIETLGAAGDGTLMDKAGVAAPGFVPVARGPDDLAAILYTSGTTGRSKGAMLSHENLASNARTLKDVWGFSGDDVLIHALPIFHTHGLFVATNTILFAGAAMLFVRRFDPAEVVGLLRRATVLMGVPTFYTRLLQQDGLTREAAAGMRLVISGSAPLLAETHAEFEARTGHAILERYGMTETNMNTSNPYAGRRVAGTVGLPLPGVEVRLTAEGRVLPPGGIGMVEIRGPNVFKGYWRNPEKTRAEFTADGFFVSGDLGTYDEAGYLTIVGRGKDIVITGGYNVYPKEVESEIDALDGVLESAVIGLPDTDLGEAVAAVVVREPGAAIDDAAIAAALKERLAGYKRPKRILFVDELPRNTMGKVQKATLRQRFGP
ncbi:MAG TPA: malonyl-CoA synthase [Lichenihabitans sp.]|jgi:malonyl-CoA/methylmalonyl-CoA synthetase|nr:malonyl-CoA synthase [Lichenihabitans sp.]